LNILNGLFRDTECELGNRAQFDKYEKEETTLSKEEWQNEWKKTVRQDWNGIEIPEEGSNSEKELLMSELKHYDAIFETYFRKVEAFYMTQDVAWTSVWPLYVDGLIERAEAEAERREKNENIKKIREELAGKLRFVMKDHGADMHMSPPFPILTKSVVPVMVKAVADIEDALNEVCGLFILFGSLLRSRQS
jgi:hypothetical protein